MDINFGDVLMICDNKALQTNQSMFINQFGECFDNKEHLNWSEYTLDDTNWFAYSHTLFSRGIQQKLRYKIYQLKDSRQLG